MSFEAKGAGAPVTHADAALSAMGLSAPAQLSRDPALAQEQQKQAQMGMKACMAAISGAGSLLAASAKQCAGQGGAALDRQVQANFELVSRAADKVLALWGRGQEAWLRNALMRMFSGMLEQGRLGQALELAESFGQAAGAGCMEDECWQRGPFAEATEDLKAKIGFARLENLLCVASGFESLGKGLPPDEWIKAIEQDIWEKACTFSDKTSLPFALQAHRAQLAMLAAGKLTGCYCQSLEQMAGPQTNACEAAQAAAGEFSARALRLCSLALEYLPPDAQKPIAFAFCKPIG